MGNLFTSDESRILASFFGIRKQSDLDNDANKLTPEQLIVAGIIAVSGVVCGGA